MPWRETLEPVRMQRVALVAPQRTWRPVLVAVADAGVVELDRVTDASETAPGEAARRLQRLALPEADPLLSVDPPDLDVLERHTAPDQLAALLAGEAALAEVSADAVRRGSVAALTGWVPAHDLPDVQARLTPLGGALVPLPLPRGTDPPTLMRSRGTLGSSFSPLVRTYATIPYADVDITVVAGMAYVLMFGMMFADAGHGLMVVAAGLLLRAGRPGRLARFQRTWPFVVAAGLSATFFGVLFGEFFGPTGVLRPVWIDPLGDPVALLGAAVGVGALMLGGAYALGSVNRWREHGWQAALVAPTGLAGVAMFLGLGLVAWGVAASTTALVVAGVVVAAAGLVLTFLGLFAAAGGGGAGAAQATVEVLDAVIGLGTSLVSFARLAAFGLAHAALSSLLADGVASLAAQGPLGVVGAVVLAVVGTLAIVAFEALVAGIQALRLEYYELFSRVFESEGSAFRPWSIPTARPHEMRWSP
jgi:V/A-type H+-transporting ATPase subunit I